jgi:hypothetical protein
LEKVDYEALNRIGDELTDLYLDGRLNLPNFQRLFHEALAICGPDSDHMEMFCQFARGEGWFDWMMQELQQASSRHVA